MRLVCKVLCTIISTATLTVSGPVRIAQATNPTTYPYGGSIDSSGFVSKGVASRLLFDTVQFEDVTFEEQADFTFAIFPHSGVRFNIAEFKDLAWFNWAVFKGSAEFLAVTFEGHTHFDLSRFVYTASFASSQFRDIASFEDAVFDTSASFAFACFDDDVKFKGVKFFGPVSFNSAGFYGKADFSDSRFDTTASFVDAVFWDTVLLGSEKSHKFNFRRTTFETGAVLLLCDLVELDIQIEKLKHIRLEETLSYFMKKDIIEHLKHTSFKEDAGARHELSYLFAKSTMYQSKTEPHEGDSLGATPSCLLRFKMTTYDWMMGLGYKSYRLFPWAVGFIIFFAFVYWSRKKMRSEVNRYVLRAGERRPPELATMDSLLNAVYFSLKVFFPLKFRRSLLTHFSTWPKVVIGFEWLLGTAFWAAFLFFTLSQSAAFPSIVRRLFGLY